MSKSSSEKTEQIFREIAEFMNEIEMQAIVLTEADGAPAVSLLIGLHGEVEEGHYVVCNHMEPEEDEEGLASYCQLFYEVPMDTDDIDELSLLKAVNAMNAVTKIGHFVWSKGSGRVHLRHSVAVVDEEELEAEVICECAQSMLDYALVMEGMIAALASGLKIEEVLADRELNLEV